MASSSTTMQEESAGVSTPGTSTGQARRGTSQRSLNRRRLGPRRSEGRGACQSVLTPLSETGGLAVARRGGERRSEPYLNGVNELPTCREAPRVAECCRELWREKGKKKATPFRLFVCSFVVNTVT